MIPEQDLEQNLLNIFSTDWKNNLFHIGTCLKYSYGKTELLLSA